MPASLKIADLTPKFLAFYELAKDEPDPERRWALWQAHYRFAAIPPTPDGMQLARRMLDESFHRYPEALERIKAGAAGFRPDPRALLEAVSRQLAFTADLQVVCTFFVGNFEQNPFAYSHEGISYVFFPVEVDDPVFASVAIPHEFTHALHSPLSGCTTPYGVSTGYLALMEGLAMQTSAAVTPGYPEQVYVSNNWPGWIEQCREREQALFEGIRPYLAVADPEVQFRFTMGTGTTGLIREAYWTGWRVVGHLLAQGKSLAELARIPEADAPALVERTLGELLG